MKDDGVKEAIREQVESSAMRTRITADRILAELFRMAVVDVGEAFAEDGSLLPISEIPTDLRRCISGIEVSEIWEYDGKVRTQVGVLKKVKFVSKEKGLEMLAKHLKLLTEKFELDVGKTLEELLTESRKGDKE